MLLVVLFCVGAFGLVSEVSHDGKWRIEEAQRSDVVGFFITLKHRNLDAFNEKVLQISTPGTALYGKFMTKDEVLDMIAPPAHVGASVVDWVRKVCSSQHVRVLDNRRDTVRVEATVSCVESLLKVRMSGFRHTEKSHVKVVRTHPESPAPKIPSRLAQHVDIVIGLDMLPVLRKKKVLPAHPRITHDVAASYGYISIDEINRVYNIPSNKVSVPKATQAVIEFSPEGAISFTDLQTYDQWSNIAFSNVSQIFGPFQPGDDGESLLDIQLISAVAQTPTVYLTVPDSWAYGMAQQIFALSNPPLVNSVSYGWPESLSCQSFVTHAHCDSANSAAAYVAKSEIELQKGAARGISFSICSQDEGAPSEQNDGCQLDSTKPVWPIYPGASAWATSVSATTLVTNNDKAAAVSRNARASPPICQKGYQCSTGTTEVPCSVDNTLYQWTTGGGFSDYVPQPSWQKKLVQTYLAATSKFPPPNAFNKTNRAYPDVAALGSRILVVSGGSISVSAGTSASTPIIAGIMTLINNARLNAGKSPIGFWNPALYQMYENCPHCFNQITSGDNRCTEGNCCEYGYFVIPTGGYNAVTGLGTINVKNAIQRMYKTAAEVNALYEKGRMSEAITKLKDMLDTLEKNGDLVTPFGLEYLIRLGRFLQEDLRFEEALTVLRRCVQFTKRDTEVEGDTTSSLYDRIDTLFQLLIFAQHPEMAMSVAKERAALQKVRPDGSKENIAQSMYKMAKEEVANQTKVLGKGAQRKKNKRAAEARTNKVLKVIEADDGEDGLVEDPTLGSALQQVGLKHLEENLKEYGVETTHDLKDMTDQDFQSCGFSAKDVAAVRSWGETKSVERISPELIVFPTKILGKGTSSLVVKGKYAGVGVVAVKILSVNVKKEVEEAFLEYQEKGLKHPRNVMAVFSKIERSFHVYVVLQFLELSLSDLYEFPGSEITQRQKVVMDLCRNAEVKILHEICAGVAFLHQHFSCCNNDLKPRNIMFDSGAFPKICDFSLATASGAEHTLTSFTTLVTAGNMGWRAPEVVLQHSRTAESDCFSVGLIAFYLFTKGRHPFGYGAGTSSDLVREQRIVNPSSKPELSELSDRLQKMLVEDLLSYKTSDRPSMVEVIKHPVFWKTAEKFAYLKRLRDDHAVKLKSVSSTWKPSNEKLLNVLPGNYVDNLSDQLRFFNDLCLAFMQKNRQVEEAVKKGMNLTEKPGITDCCEYFLQLNPKLLAVCVEKVGDGSDEMFERKMREEASRKVMEENRLREARAEQERQEIENIRRKKREAEEEKLRAEQTRKEVELERKKAEQKALELLKEREDKMPIKIEQKKLEKEKKKKICKNWLNTGSCRFGDRCNYKHEAPKKEVAPKKSHTSSSASSVPRKAVAARTEPLVDVLKEAGLANLIEPLRKYGIDTCADLQEMDASDFHELQLDIDQRQVLLTITRSDNNVLLEDLSLKQVMRMMGLGGQLYEKLIEYGVESVNDVREMKEDDFRELGLTALERESLTTGVFFSKRGKRISNDLVVYLDKIIGRGTSVVCEGLSLTHGAVAVKIVSRNNRRHVTAEVEALRKLDMHPNVVSYFGKYEDSFDSFIMLSLCVMNLRMFVEGDKGNLTEAQFLLQQKCQGHELRLAKEILSGLAFIHGRKNFNHRDLKPENILLDKEGTAKISDFGIAKKNEGEPEDTMSLTHTLTQTRTGTHSYTNTKGTLAGIGTQGWRAPEVIFSAAARTQKADCYSTGLILFFLFSHGKHPFMKKGTEGSTEVEQNIKNEKFVPLSLPDKFQNHLVRQFLTFDPEKRITIRQSLTHPLFLSWSERFLYLKKAFEMDSPVFRNYRNINWQSAVPGQLAAVALESSKLKVAYQDHMHDLLRFIRNLGEHVGQEGDAIGAVFKKLLKLDRNPTREDVIQWVHKMYPVCIFKCFELIGNDFERISKLVADQERLESDVLKEKLRVQEEARKAREREQVEQLSSFVQRQAPPPQQPQQPRPAFAQNLAQFPTLAQATSFTPANRGNQPAPVYASYPLGTFPVGPGFAPPPPVVAAAPGEVPCLACRSPIPVSLSFCGICGTGIVCGKCGNNNPLKFKFCGVCGFQMK